MKTYIPKQSKQIRERLEVKVDSTVLQTLERYCQYLESDRDYVVGCVLQLAFRKDKGFAAWLGRQAAGPSTPSKPTSTGRLSA